MITRLFIRVNSKVKLARTAGALYLLIIAFGLVAQVFVRDALVNYGDAAITARNILASEFWYRFGFVSELMMLVCDVGVTAILYILFRSTAGNLSVVTTSFRLASISILGITALAHYAALFFLDGAPYLAAFNAEQLNGLALLSVKLHGAGYNISLFFFGFHLLFLGRLICVSALLPKVLGVLLAAGGVCYIVNSCTWFLFPSFVKTIYPAILIPCFSGELLLSLWLLAKGVKVINSGHTGE